jgi:acyl-CoA dehydrogenase
MDFDLSQDQKDIQEQVLKFAKNVMATNASKYDLSGEFPKEILKQAWELGFVNLSIPSDFGGTGFSTIESALITETLAYGCMGMTTTLMANDLALLPIVIGASDEQKKRFLTPFTEDYKIASFCLTEPENGSDAAGIKTQIKDDGDHYIVSGNKMWITNAGFADLFVVYGVTDKDAGHKGLSVIAIEAGTPGIEIGKPEKKMGHCCSDTRAVTFKDVKVPKKNLIGKPGQGWEIAMKTLNHSRITVAACAVGGAQAALDHAIRYSNERKQFGVTIGKHQAIQFMLADMAIKVETSRLLVQKAAWLLDQGRPSPRQASFAKAHAADSCMQVATDAVQIFGGYGYSKEYPVEKIMRDAKLIQIYEGTSQIQRLVIAKDLLTH